MVLSYTSAVAGCISGRVQSTKLVHALRWRHNDLDGVSNHQPYGCLLNRLFRRRSKKTSKLRVTGLCAGNSPGPVNSPHKGPVTRKMFPFDDVIMIRALLCFVVVSFRIHPNDHVHGWRFVVSWCGFCSEYIPRFVRNTSQESRTRFALCYVLLWFWLRLHPQIMYTVRAVLCFVVVLFRIYPKDYVHGSHFLLFSSGFVQNTSQESCTRFALCCCLLWLISGYFIHIILGYMTGTWAIVWGKHKRYASNEPIQKDDNKKTAWMLPMMYCKTIL